MGRVWAARHELTSRDVAVKVLREDLASHPEALSRFVREARAAGQLRHPNIIDVLDVGAMDDGRPYLVFELLTGEGLDALLARARTLPSAVACRHLAPIASALHRAHQAGIVHRDVSPANVYLARIPGHGEVTPKILDFGISKVLGPRHDGTPKTGDGAVLGCPQYMSPEQASGAESVDARTDIWSLGVVLYECVAGVVPFRAANYNSLMCAILTTPHRPVSEAVPGIDPAVAAIIERCLEKDRDLRFANAGALAAALDEVASATGGAHCPAMPPSLADRARGVVRGWQLLARAASPRRLVISSSAVGGSMLGVTLGVAVAGNTAPPALSRWPAHQEALARAISTVERSAGPTVTPVVGALADAESTPRKARRAAPRAPRRAVDPSSLPLWDQPLTTARARPETPRATEGRTLPQLELASIDHGLPRDNPYRTER